MADKKPTDNRFIQPGGTVRKVTPQESWRDLSPKKQRARMRAMYTTMPTEEQK